MIFKYNAGWKPTELLPGPIMISDAAVIVAKIGPFSDDKVLAFDLVAVGSRRTFLCNFFGHILHGFAARVAWAIVPPLWST